MPKSFSPPKYRHFKPRNLAVVRINGRDHYLGMYDSPESWERYHRLLADRARIGTAVPCSADKPDEVTVTELAARFFRHAETYYRRSDGSPTHEVNNIRQALRVLRELFGSTNANDFGPLKLQAVRQAMIERGWSRGNINRAVRRVVLCFQWACQHEFVKPNIYHGLKCVKGLQKGRSDAKETGDVKPVPDVDVDAVLPLVRPQVAAMIRLQRLTGARPGEVLAMRGTELDRSGTVWVFRPVQHKNAWRGHAREIYLGPQAQEIVRAFLKGDANTYLFSPAEAEVQRDAERRAARDARQRGRTPSQLARKPKANPKRQPADHYTVPSYAKAIARACKKATVPHWHPHQLRHAAATEYKRLFGTEVARVILGHRSVSMTEHYAETDAARAIKVVMTIG
ncbi:MAG: site-specific integrase [Planctomycetia bacterium]|nr:site-specific integrase [Planctomycetia bacterium]